MKLVLFEEPGGTGPARLGLLTDGGVVDLADVAPSGRASQEVLRAVIDSFDELRPRFEQAGQHRPALPLDSTRLRAPIPRPGKILCSTSRCRAARDSAPEPLLMTLKSAECVVGPGDDVEIPETFEPWQFVPEVELAMVIKGPAKRIAADDWRSAVFGFTCAIDVAARGGPPEFGRDNWVAKSDTLCPLGPCIVTADEVPDPAALGVRSWLNGEPRQDFSYASADYDVGAQLALITTVMALHSGDVVVLGSSTQDAGTLADGDCVAVEIDRIGRLEVGVRDVARAGAGRTAALNGAGR